MMPMPSAVRTGMAGHAGSVFAGFTTRSMIRIAIPPIISATATTQAFSSSASIWSIR
jgi:hypothetical protein